MHTASVCVGEDARISFVSAQSSSSEQEPGSVAMATQIPDQQKAVSNPQLGCRVPAEANSAPLRATTPNKIFTRTTAERLSLHDVTGVKEVGILYLDQQLSAVSGHLWSGPNCRNIIAEGCFLGSYQII